jgi:hypothetical protein
LYHQYDTEIVISDEVMWCHHVLGMKRISPGASVHSHLVAVLNSGNRL